MGFFSKLFGWDRKPKSGVVGVVIGQDDKDAGDDMSIEYSELSEEPGNLATDNVVPDKAVSDGETSSNEVNSDTLVVGESEISEPVVEDVKYEYPTLDKELVDLYCKLMKEYGKILIDKLKKELNGYIVDNDLLSKATKRTSIQERFELSGEEFDVLVEVILLEHEYNNLSQDLSDLLGFLSEDISNFEVFDSDIQEFKQKQDELKGKILEFLSSHQSLRPAYSYKADEGDNVLKTEEYPELVGIYNFLIFSSTVEIDRKIIMESNYGDKEGAINAVASEINKLSAVSYTLLSGKGAVHFLQDYVEKNHYRVYHQKINCERIGARKSKISYILLPVNSANLAMLKKHYSNLVGERIILILNFGYLGIGKGSEKDLYQHFRTSTDKITEEIEKIVDLFGTPFSQDSFEEACSMIERGVDIIRTLNDNPDESLDLIDKRRCNGKK